MKKLLYLGMTCALGGLTAPAAFAEGTTTEAAAEQKFTAYTIEFSGGG